MADLDDKADGTRQLDPEDVSTRTFPTAFRGFDPVKVRAFLGTVADELRRLQVQEEELRRSIEEARTAAEVAAAEAADAGAAGSDGAATPAAGTAQPDDGPPAASTDAIAATLVEEAKAEADRLLREARERVETLGAAAAAETTRVLEDARAEAARLRATATDDLKGRSDDAEATAVRKIAEAEREAASLRVTAREEADATIEAARERGREMVAEAQAARERMLADLAKRKRAAHAQLEQLRAGRDRLLDTLKAARRSIDEMTNRFDAGGGGSEIPSASVNSATPVGSITTSPGSATSDIRPRAAHTSAMPREASAAAPDQPQPVRARAVVIGEMLPGDRPATPPAGARAAADRAGEADIPSAEAATTSPGAGAPASATSGGPRSDERRSSALRILRRHKPNEAPQVRPPLIGRDSSAEGVRIIGRPSPVPPDQATPPATPAEPVDAPDLDVPAAVGAGGPDAGADSPFEPEAGPDPEPGTDVDLDAEAVAAGEAPAESLDPEEPIDPAEPVRESVSVEATAELATPPAPPERIGAEEIRPRIEDLFARIRADREAATASARMVLSAASAAESDPSGESSAALPAATAQSGNGQEGASADLSADPPDDRGAAPGADADGDEHALQARDAVTEPLIGQLTKRLKRALQDEQNASLDRLRTGRGPASVDRVLSTLDLQTTPYRHLAMPLLDQAGRAGAAVSNFGPVGVAVDDLAAQLADDLAGAIRARIDGLLGSAAADDVDLASLSERISAVYRDWKIQRVERLATHYLVAAHERGAFLARTEGTALRWVVDDDAPCPDCDDNALAGATPRGEVFPTGQLHPPAHLGCRCLLVATGA